MFADIFVCFFRFISVAWTLDVENVALFRFFASLNRMKNSQIRKMSTIREQSKNANVTISPFFHDQSLHSRNEITRLNIAKKMYYISQKTGKQAKKFICSAITFFILQSAIKRCNNPIWFANFYIVEKHVEFYDPL